MADKDTAIKVPIEAKVETNAAEAAESVDSLRDSIMGSTESIRAMRDSLRLLKGNTDEVKAAKEQLRAKVKAEENAISAAALKLAKAGQTYDAAAMKAKKLAEVRAKSAAEIKKEHEARAKEQIQAMTAAITKAGGPVASLTSKLSSYKEIAGGASSATGLVTLAAAGAVAAVAALTAAVVAGAAALGRFILQAGNAARSAGLLREAWSGTAGNAANLGTQIDALAGKVPTGKAALNELAIGLMRLRLPGQATVDALNAIGQASAALGDEAGKKLEAFITRGRLVGRMQINPAEMLEGFGNLSFDDVAKALASSMRIGVADARKALAEGRVKLGDGAKAVRDAVEGKFAGLNLRKMLDLNVIADKAKEKLSALTKDVKLEPLLKAFGEFATLLDESTVSGSVLKQLVTAFGDGMVTALTAAIPLAKEFLIGLEVKALRAYVEVLKLRKAFRETFGDVELVKGTELVKLALEGVQIAAVAVGAAVVAIGAGVAVMVGPFIALRKASDALVEGFGALVKSLRETDWRGLGASIVDGLVGGLVDGVARVDQAVGRLSSAVKQGFKKALGIASPSRVMLELGKQVPAGAAKGIEQGSPAVQGASRAMGLGAASAAGGGGRAASVTVNVTINAGGGDPSAVADASFLAKLTKAVEDALVGAGIPVQS